MTMTFSHVYREANIEANALAKQGIGAGKSCVTGFIQKKKTPCHRRSAFLFLSSSTVYKKYCITCILYFYL